MLRLFTKGLTFYYCIERQFVIGGRTNFNHYYLCSNVFWHVLTLALDFGDFGVLFLDTVALVDLLVS